MSITTDPNDPRLAKYREATHDDVPVPQQEVYLALSADEIAKGYVKPFRLSYRHLTCGTETVMPDACAKTIARDPWFYSGTYCVHCGMHRALSEFVWLDGESMSPNDWEPEEHQRIAKLRKKAKREEQLDLPIG